MVFKIEYNIETEEDAGQEEQVLAIEVYTDYPNEPIEVKLDNGSGFGTQTDDEGICRCSTSEIQDYHVIVLVHGEIFEDDIILEETNALEEEEHVPEEEEEENIPEEE